jgi:hypothetical protein
MEECHSQCPLFGDIYPVGIPVINHSATRTEAHSLSLLVSTMIMRAYPDFWARNGKRYRQWRWLYLTSGQPKNTQNASSFYWYLQHVE